MNVPLSPTLVVGLFIALIQVTYAFPDYGRRNQIKCHPIQEPLCADLNYNVTSMPNTVGHDTQQEASSRIREFLPLIESKCSVDLPFFLCSLYFPMCAPKANVVVPACRPMCEDVRSRCEPLMLTFGLTWSDSIDCTKLPVASDKERLCMQPPRYNRNTEIEVEDESPDEIPPYQLPESRPGFQDSTEKYPIDSELEYKIAPPDLSSNAGSSQNPVDSQPHNDYDDPKYNNDAQSYDTLDSDEDWMKSNNEYNEDNILNEPDYNPSQEGVGQDVPFDDELHAVNPPILQENPLEVIPLHQSCSNPSKFIYLEKSDKCVSRCGQGVDVVFSSSDKKLAHILLSVCATLCFLSTAVTVSTFVADSKRFRYPERPVIFLSICYNAYSVGYLLRTISGINHPLSCVMNESLNAEHLIKGGFESTSCSASFFILYYFGMSASAWWVMLNLTWFLSAGFKWGHEAIEGFGVYFHLVAWGLPAVQTAAVLILAKMDGDELTGVCYVGNLDPEALMYFVIIPLTFYLLTGTVALVFGLKYLFNIRRVIKHQNGKEAANLEKLMIKIGIFSILYTVPATCVVAVHFYQYQNYASWINEASHVPCVFVNYDKSDYYYQDGSESQDVYSDWRASRHNFPQSWTNQHNPAGYHYGPVTSRDVNGQRAARSLNNKAHFASQPYSLFDSRKGPDELGLNCRITKSIPSIPIFFIKIAMPLIAGIMSGIWVWSAKTVQSWKTFCYSCRWKQAATKEAENDQSENLYQTPDVGNCLLEGSSTTSRIIRAYEEDAHFNGKPQCYHQSLERRRKYPDDFYCFNTSRLPVAPEARKFLQSGSYGRSCSQADSSCCRLSGSRDIEGASTDERPFRPQFAHECQVITNCHSKRVICSRSKTDYVEQRVNPMQSRHSNPSSQTHLTKHSTRCSREDENRLYFQQIDNCPHPFRESNEARTEVIGFQSHHPITNNHLMTNNRDDKNFEAIQCVHSY